MRGRFASQALFCWKSHSFAVIQSAVTSLKKRLHGATKRLPRKTRIRRFFFLLRIKLDLIELYLFYFYFLQRRVWVVLCRRAAHRHTLHDCASDKRLIKKRTKPKPKTQINTGYIPPFFLLLSGQTVRRARTHTHTHTHARTQASCGPHTSIILMLMRANPCFFPPHFFLTP